MISLDFGQVQNVAGSSTIEERGIPSIPKSPKFVAKNPAPTRPSSIWMEPQWLRESRRDCDMRNLRSLSKALSCWHGVRMGGYCGIPAVLI